MPLSDITAYVIISKPERSIAEQMMHLFVNIDVDDLSKAIAFLLL